MNDQKFNVLANFARAFANEVEVGYPLGGQTCLIMDGKTHLASYNASIAMLRELSRQELISNFSDMAYTDGLKIATFVVADDISLSSIGPSTSPLRVGISRGLAHRIQNGVSFNFDPLDN